MGVGVVTSNPNLKNQKRISSLPLQNILEAVRNSGCAIFASSTIQRLAGDSVGVSGL